MRAVNQLLEPYDDLASGTTKVAVYYNPNIQPAEEYERRLDPGELPAGMDRGGLNPTMTSLPGWKRWRCSSGGRSCAAGRAID
jgi:hypothetical protein